MTITELRIKLEQLEEAGGGDLRIVAIAPEWENQTEHIIMADLPLPFPWKVDSLDAVIKDGNVYMNLTNSEIL